MKAVEVKTIVTELEQDFSNPSGTTANTGVATTGGTGSSVLPVTQPFELGPTLDVVPYVRADNYTIEMTIIPVLKEFLGYDDPGPFVAQIQSVSSINAAPPIITPTPLPKFRVRQVATTATVWDGQTVALGGLIAEDLQKWQDKVPVLGDLPFVGRLFQSNARKSSKQNLVIFVTPRLIDPSGNPMHTDDEMPFASHSTPSQTAQAGTASTAAAAVNAAARAN